MKQTNLILALAGLALPALALTATTHVGKDTGREMTGGRQLTAAPAPAFSATPQRVVKIDGFLYENFESVADDSTDLPEGWTAIATPGLDSDTWHVGTLGRDGTPLNGVSGFKYAYILGNRETDSPHDAWLFSPTLRMEAGTEYTIEFFALMPPVTGSDTMEKLRVCICSGQKKDAVVTELETIENDNDYWRYYGYSFTPEESGEYAIGFNSLSPANSNSTVIDDLKISSGPLPIFSASAEVDLGSTDTRQMNLSASYRISNGGTAPLEVSLESASEGVTVTGLPLTLESYDDEKITISAVAKEAGDYEGFITLATNDPTLPSVRVSLSGSVDQARVTGYNFENFEAGGPEGWELSYGAGNVAVYGGHDSSRAYYTTTMYSDDDRNAHLNGVGFTTHYVEMGSEPKVNFWYQIAMVDFGGNVTGAPDSKYVKMSVLVSDDNGASYTPVYEMTPDGENKFNSTTAWQQLSVDLPQYAGKTCRVRVVFDDNGGVDFFNQMRCMADDVELGTKVANDLRATSLTGNALLAIGSRYHFDAVVENLGAEPMSDYKVELFDTADGSVLDTADGTEVKAGEKGSVRLSWTPSEAGYTALAARIVSDSDPVEDNNVSYTHHACILPAGNSAISIDHGDPLASMAYPVNFYVVESATQSIFKANEIGTTEGVINSIVFTSYLDADFYGEPFEVYIAETDRDDYSDGKFIDPESFTKVFQGAVYMQSGTRDLVIPFDRPFHWNGKNIAVMCRKLGKEFVLGKYFVIHKSREEFRSIQTTSYTVGALDYDDAIVNEVYPQIRFNIVKAPAGTVHGTVKDADGPVEGALVRIKDTQRTEVTDAEGRFSFPEAAAGECFVEVSKHGYYTLKDAAFSLAEGATEQRDITITPLPRHTVDGTVTSAAGGQPVMNARVAISGYDDFTTFTDDKGHYSIEGVAADTGADYDLAVFDSYFINTRRSLDVDGDKTVDFSLEENILRPHNPKATDIGSGALVTWEAPLPEFRHDSGQPVDYIGWTHGQSEVIVGAAFHKKARIKEISWYVTDKYGAHSNFNVFIFGLDAEGKPDPENILYVSRNVEFRENAWSTHVLGNAVEADGFMIAVSCDGFMGIGICEPSDDYPFEEGQAYYAGDSYNLTISNMSSFAKVHPMLRAFGDDLENINGASTGPADSEAIIRPSFTYNIYRVVDGETSGLIASTDSESYLDTEGATGHVCYDIKASYASGDSEAARTNVISLTSIKSLIDAGIALGPNPVKDILTISGCEKIRNLTVTSTSGLALVNIDSPSDHIDVTHLAPGVYIATITLTDNSTHNLRIVKK